MPRSPLVMVALLAMTLLLPSSSAGFPSCAAATREPTLQREEHYVLVEGKEVEVRRESKGYAGLQTQLCLDEEGAMRFADALVHRTQVPGLQDLPCFGAFGPVPRVCFA